MRKCTLFWKHRHLPFMPSSVKSDCMTRSGIPVKAGGTRPASLSSETLARLDSSNSKQKLLFSPTRGAAPPSSAHRRLYSAGSTGEGDATPPNSLLRTMSLMGGHSRAGSVAGTSRFPPSTFHRREFGELCVDGGPSQLSMELLLHPSMRAEIRR